MGRMSRLQIIVGLPHVPINSVGNRIAIAPDVTPTMAANRSRFLTPAAQRVDACDAQGDGRRDFGDARPVALHGHSPPIRRRQRLAMRFAIGESGRDRQHQRCQDHHDTQDRFHRFLHERIL